MAKNQFDNPHIGSNFDDFLREEGIYEEVQAAAAKKVLAWQIENALAKQKLSKDDLALKMQISCSAVNRLLDPEEPSIDLETAERAARVLGKKLSIQLVEG